MSVHKHLYNTAAWKRQRAAQLRAHPLCRMHLELGQVVGATIADHVVPHRGDREFFFNGQLQSLCKRCHDSAKQAQEKGDGLLRGAGLDGKPLDLNHHWNRTVGAVQNSTPHQAKTGPFPLFSAARNWGGGGSE